MCVHVRILRITTTQYHVHRTVRAVWYDIDRHSECWYITQTKNSTVSQCAQSHLSNSSHLVLINCPYYWDRIWIEVQRLWSQLVVSLVSVHFTVLGRKCVQFKRLLYNDHTWAHVRSWQSFVASMITLKSRGVTTLNLPSYHHCCLLSNAFLLWNSVPKAWLLALDPRLMAS